MALDLVTMYLAQFQRLIWIARAASAPVRFEAVVRAAWW
jgi:hypothetical protein